MSRNVADFERRGYEGKKRSREIPSKRRRAIVLFSVSQTNISSRTS